MQNIVRRIIKSVSREQMLETCILPGIPTFYIVFSYEISVYVFLIREDSTDRPLSEQQENAFLT